MIHALVVAGDQATRFKISEIIERHDVSTSLAATLEQARAELRRDAPRIIFLDGPLPDGAPIDLLFHVSPRRTRRVILIGDDPAVGEAIRSLGSGRLGFLPKPVTAAKVKRTLGEAMRSGRPLRRRKRQGAKKFGAMLGDCHAMREVYTLIAKVAPTDASVLIVGESGAGKELVANAIHERGARKGKPFIATNCGAIPENLVESELFGHEKGAFTGADRMRKGVFERAGGGTLFLDEISEMSPELQVRLLRVLENGVINRVGGEKDIKADARIIAATNRDVHEAVNDGQLREDLLYRLSVVTIDLPPLRERGDDIVLLANHFLSELNQEHGGDKHLSPLAIRRLRAYHWPGNVRQLRNMIYRAFIVEGDTIDLGFIERLVTAAERAEAAGRAHGPPQVSPHSPRAAPAQADTAADAEGEANGDVQLTVGTSIDDAEEQLIRTTLEAYDGDKRKAAEVLGISLKTLYNRLNEYKSVENA